VLVTGTVTGAHGNPLSSVRVVLQTALGDPVESTLTNSSGVFAFSGVPAGSYAVVVRVRGYRTGSWPIQVSRSNLVGLNLSLMPAGGRLSSRRNSAKGPATISVRHLLIPSKARQEYERALKSDARGQIAEAIAQWKNSIKIYPKYAASYMQLSRVYADHGQFPQALAAAKHAVALTNKNAESLCYLGYVYVHEKEFALATATFRQAVRRSGSMWFSQFWLGWLLLRQNDAAAAYPHLARARDLRPEMPQVYLLLYNDLLRLDRGKDALAVLDAFLKHFPKNPFAPEARAKRASLEKSLRSEAH
jgi:tetratricopeptide (TPR) repeat protein